MLLKATNKKKHLFSRFLFLFGFILFQPPYFSVFCNPSGVLYQNSRAHTFTNTYITPTPRIRAHAWPPPPRLLPSSHSTRDAI